MSIPGARGRGEGTPSPLNIVVQIIAHCVLIIIIIIGYIINATVRDNRQQHD
jgi:hypothetical protein